MNRRNFIKLSSLALLPILSCQKSEKSDNILDFDISFHSDMAVGHLVFESHNFPKGKTENVDYLIVGAGIAGLSIAWNLRENNILLCELSDRIGGSSGSENFEGEVFGQGAHYDLTYPKYFGEEAIELLENLGVVKFNSLIDKWDFVDKKYLISPHRESQCFNGIDYYDELLPEGKTMDEFFELMKPFIGNFMLPTRLIPADYQHFNQISFYDFLKSSIDLSPEFKAAIDYHMRDDFGGTSEDVSAIAGLYYYANRGYLTSETEIFSPPEGNYYFAHKLATQLPENTIRLNHLVKKIRPVLKGFEVEVIDIKSKTIKTFQANKVVYAGQKHALQHIMPSQKKLFATNQYVPWLVINFVVESDLNENKFWQNEILSDHSSFLGFVDSAAQMEKTKNRVLTAYYCFRMEDRKYLAALEENKEDVVKNTIGIMAGYFKIPSEEFAGKIKKVFMKVMGHAMPLASPGYLFNDRNLYRPHSKMVYAGVDNGRLPLFMEALDSGLMAKKYLKEG
ncbi:FAD-dependent oxidoreductase [Flexithrix dorotheae]|uniref:FAD-dependent oxidoreductase n=1 Tax=Flexithrix dorotheae TaxID=70993 RepID=UPI0003759831|nr:FAD-dependent oxidoreductase [Flexithrix dorotheae]